MVKENIKSPDERTLILEGEDDTAFAYAYVELKEAAKFAHTHFNGFPMDFQITRFHKSNTRRYSKLPKRLKDQAKAYSRVYPCYNNRNIELTQGLQSEDYVTFISAFEELVNICECLRQRFSDSPLYKRLVKRKREYAPKQEILKTSSNCTGQDNSCQGA